MDLWTALHLLGLLNAAEASYSVHTDPLAFREAQERCRPGGFLTNVPTGQDRERILRAVRDRPEPGAFWIGLRKNKGSCVQHHLELKGFVWTLDNSTRSEGNSWRSGPLETCTDPRCGLLWVDYSGAEARILGFGDAGCRQKHPFICKRHTEPDCPLPFIHQSASKTIRKEDPFTLEVQCQSGARFILTCSNGLSWTLVGNQEADISQLCLECNAGFRRDTSGNCVDVNECEESRPCRHRCENSEGSYRCHCGPDCQDPESSTRDPGRREEDDSRNASSSEGGSGSATADYESANKTAVHIEEFSADISHIVVPVIIALLVLVVLLVVIAAVVKACLRRRSIKRARRKAETVALNGSSSVEKVNEKEET